MKRETLAALCGVALTLTPFVPSQSPSGFGNLVVFGDSLSDNGNYFRATGQPGAPYFKGRFSNGRVWAEQLAAPLGLDRIEDHAMGFATTSDVFAQQVVPYLTAHGGIVPPNSLYIVWAGANDLIDVLEAGTNPTAAIQNAMVQTTVSVGALITAGARHVMVPNLPDLGATPRVQAAGPSAVAAARQLTIAYNQTLAATVGMMQALLDTDIFELDVFGLLDEVVANPARFELRNVTQPALSPSGTVVEYPNTYLFWDDIHPTAAGHSILREAALRQLSRTPRFANR